MFRYQCMIDRHSIHQARKATPHINVLKYNSLVTVFDRSLDVSAATICLSLRSPRESREILNDIDDME